MSTILFSFRFIPNQKRKEKKKEKKEKKRKKKKNTCQIFYQNLEITGETMV